MKKDLNMRLWKLFLAWLLGREKGSSSSECQYTCRHDHNDYSYPIDYTANNHTATHYHKNNHFAEEDHHKPSPEPYDDYYHDSHDDWAHDFDDFEDDY